jgi:predicted enzyme related to lactoylglutathione lyase
MKMLNFSYVRLLVPDYPACFRFYRDVMDFNVSTGDEQSGYAELQTGNVTIALFDRQAMAQAINNTAPPLTAECQDRFALIFAVPDVDEMYAKLKERGAHMIQAPVDRPDWDIRTAHFRDPVGNLIEINTRLKP